jgi:hypothetical protein
MAHAFDDSAFGGFAGDDDTGIMAKGIGGGVEAEVCLAGLGIGPVAWEAKIAKDWKDIAVESGGRLVGPGHGKPESYKKGEVQGSVHGRKGPVRRGGRLCHFNRI